MKVNVATRPVSFVFLILALVIVKLAHVLSLVPSEHIHIALNAPVCRHMLLSQLFSGTA
jgi:hypothetical protein